MRLWLAVALAAVVVQQSLTTYPEPDVGYHLLWGGFSVFLLYRIYRGSQVARGLFLALAVLGAAIYATGIGSQDRASWLALAFAVQAAVMLAPSVRAWGGTSAGVPQELPKAA